jgi:hypothetical protein
LTRLVFMMGFILASIGSLGASPTTADTLIVTQGQNEAWLDYLERQGLKEQLFTLKARLLEDTAVYLSDASCRLGLSTTKETIQKEEKGVRGICKPILIFDGHPVWIANSTPTSSVKQLAHILTADNVKTLTILRDARATALYGSKASCGAFIFELKKKKLLKKIRKINSL